MKVMGALAHFSQIQDIARLLYYLTGANTERQAVLAYNVIHDGMTALGFADDLDRYAREVGRIEAQLLWSHEQGRRCARASTSTVNAVSASPPPDQPTGEPTG